MGMPISNYTVLRTLVEGGEAIERYEVKQALAPYNFYAFIIHDPEKDTAFDQHLAHNFARYHVLTGDKLLFFALVDPPGSWLARAESYAYYRPLQSAIQGLGDPDLTPLSRNAGLTAFALTEWLSIPVDALPVIVVTHNFRSHDLFWFSTDSDLIRDQLAELGYIASQHVKKHDYRLSIRQVLDAHTDDPHLFGQSQRHGWSDLLDPLADLLLNVLSAVVAGEPTAEHLDVTDRRKAQRRAAEVLLGLQRKLERTKHPYREEEVDQEDLVVQEQIAMRILSLQSLLFAGQDSDLRSFLPVDPQILEADSYRILRTAQSVYAALTGDREHSPLLSRIEDHSPSVIGLAKVFEREINLSVVHWIRQYLRVDLPEFYGKYQPGLNGKYKGGDFNSKRDNLWKPPALGESKSAFKSLTSDGNFPEHWSSQLCNELLTHWDVVHEHRNRAAHAALVDAANAQRLHQEMVDIATAGYFQHFYELKRTLSGAQLT